MNLQVSVLIPAFNSAELLPPTIDAILAQTLAPEEVIVVDDGSTDDMQSAILPFGDRVRYFRTENGGICRARNTAAALASSPFLAFCDHDDLWRKDKLAQQMALHEQNPRLEYSFTNFAFVVDGAWSESTKLDDAPSGFFGGTEPAKQSAFEYDGSLYEQLLTFQPIWPSTIVISRDFFQRLGGFREELGKNPSEDLEFTLRCVQQGPIGIVRDAVVGVRRHSSNFSADNYKNTLGQLDILRYVIDHHNIPDSTRNLVLKQIELRRIEASYGAFRVKDFAMVSSLLRDVPGSSLDLKARLKRLISRLPVPLATQLHKVLSAD